MIDKVLYRLYAYDVIEKLGRMASLLNRWESENTIPPALSRHLHDQLRQAQSVLIREKQLFTMLYSDGDDGNQDPESFQDIRHHLGTVESAIFQTGQWIQRIQAPGPSVELQHFLQTSLPLSLLSSIDDRLILFSPHPSPLGSDTPVMEPIPTVLMDVLPMVEKDNPLAWVRLAQSYAHRLASAHKRKWAQAMSATGDKEAGKKKSPIPELSKSTTLALAQAMLGLRMCGPAYYFQTLIDAVRQEDAFYFHQIEPALFHSIQFANLSDKTVVILHEGAERLRESFSFAPEESESCLAESKNLNGLNNLLNAVEEVLPTRQIFSDKSFQRTLQLQERVAQGVMISASTQYTMPDVAEAIEEAYGSDEENFEPLDGADGNAIYKILTMVGEEVHRPLDMINAGWLHRVNRAPAWLYDTLQGMEAAAEEDTDALPLNHGGFARLIQRIEQQDRILLKSIETAEVHRVLLGMGAPAAVRQGD